MKRMMIMTMVWVIGTTCFGSPTRTTATAFLTRTYRSSSRSSSSTPFASWTTTTSLGVTWFGGTAETEANNNDNHGNNNNNGDSCELVAVRIERTSANSRRILGEIVVQAPLDDVWDILTDYDRLAVHVPNLVESRIVQRQTPQQTPGDGAFRCRLFQKGAQKIVGFEFGASVTMDMVERVLTTTTANTNNNNNNNTMKRNNGGKPLPTTTAQTRIIQFKCHDSFFFQTFDGEWKAVEQQSSNGDTTTTTTTTETLLSYVVDVRPKGPVPVAALEWRIREDVPTNLRAVKTAALSLRKQRQQQHSQQQQQDTSVGPSLQDTEESLNMYDNNNSNNNKLRAPKETVALPFQKRQQQLQQQSPPRTMLPRSNVSLTPRQLQEQQAAAAARRALRAPRVSAFAQAATPPPRARRAASGSSKSNNNNNNQNNTAPTRRMKVKVDWDDNETLGAYLKQP